MKLKKVAVIIQNNVQFESFVGAIDIMLDKNIEVDIYVPDVKGEDGLDHMYDQFYDLMKKSKYNILRTINNIDYDILFTPYEISTLNDIKRRLTIKYMYGMATKPYFSLSLKINYIFDGFLCYGDKDSEYLSNYGKTFKVGNMKYINHVSKKSTNKTSKKKILYLPTYGNESSIDLLIPKLEELKSKYDISIKMHHGTEYLKNDIEKKRKEKIYSVFSSSNIYLSKDSISDLIDDSDVVVTDLSGALFDAIYLRKPVIMFYPQKYESYGNLTPLPIECAQKGYYISFCESQLENFAKYISVALSKEYLERQNEVFDILCCCDKDGSKEKFIEFLNSIEKDIFSEDYLNIHCRMREDVKKYINDKKETDIAINESNNEINRLNIEIDKQNEEINKVRHENLNLQNEIENEKFKNKQVNDTLFSIYNSRSWKLVEKLRKIKKIIVK